MDLPTFLHEHSTPLDPIPTGIDPKLPQLSGIRAVAFDVYGTLFISGSGDIGTATASGREETMRSLLVAAGLGDPPSGLVDRFIGWIRSDHALAKAAGTAHPEVEIREIWQSFLTSLDLDLSPAAIERLSIEYECAVNPVWPMPNLAASLAAIRERGLPLAIVSNAQFFTPLMFDAFLGNSTAELGFEPELSIWSFAHRHAKPGSFLYQRLAEALEQRGIAPGEVLYVGNDMRNDVAPAAATGFRTVLFAGDQRSLRLRESDQLGVTPDAVITDLSQLPDIL